MAVRNEMPDDWDDHAGWDKYYTAYREAGQHLDRFELNHPLYEALHFFKHLDRERIKKVWFPGCGTTLGPRVYAALGFQVWASDVSPVAISIQEELRQRPLVELLDDHHKSFAEPANPPGELHFVTHDYRQPFVEGDFDLIVNIKAVQRMQEPGLSQALKVHYDALRPGGYAIFSTMNMYKLSEAMEKTMVACGFVTDWIRENLAQANTAGTTKTAMLFHMS
jgi:SAM-dependent methyltransferase